LYHLPSEDAKVLIPAITSQPELAPDFDGFYSNNKTSIVVCPEPNFVCAVCNSSVGRWFAKKVFATKQNDCNDYEPRYSSQFPIPPATDAQKAELSDLAENCAAAKAEGDKGALADREAQIDAIVSKLFQLTPEEIELIESRETSNQLS
jgi:hypothetical protein